MQSCKAQHQHFRSRAHMHIHAPAKYSWANAWPNAAWAILVKYNRYLFFFFLLLQQHGDLKWFRVWHLPGAAVSRLYYRGLTDRCSSTSWFQASSKPSFHPYVNPSTDENSQRTSQLTSVFENLAPPFLLPSLTTETLQSSSLKTNRPFQYKTDPQPYLKIFKNIHMKLLF